MYYERDFLRGYAGGGAAESFSRLTAKLLGYG